MPKMIEVLKEKKLNKKKVLHVIEDIQKYSSITSTEKPAFDSEKTQKNYVMSLIQSALDLLSRRAELKIIIDQTNIKTKIRIPKGIIIPEEEISIAEALMFKLNYKEYQAVFNALNKTLADSKLMRGMQYNVDGSKSISIQLYDEEFKNNYLKDLQNKFDFIDAHLEMLNATTDVVS